MVNTETAPAWTKLAYPTLAPERNGEKTCVFWLTEEITVTLFCGYVLTIPVGFTTDGASVPKFLQGIFPAIGDHLLADIIHDRLYHTNELPKDVADQEFFKWMNYLRPTWKSWVDNRLRYMAVVWFGRGAYKKKGVL